MKTQANKSDLTQKLAALRDIEKDAQKQRMALLKRDLRRAVVQVCYDYDDNTLGVFWRNGPGQPDDGEFEIFTDDGDFSHFVRRKYDGLDLESNEMPDDPHALFRLLLARVSGCSEPAPHEAKLKTKVQAADADDDEDED